MNQAFLRAPLELSKGVLGLAPVAGTSAETGVSIDRTSYSSVIVDVAYVATGAPTNTAVSVQLQDSADNATFANFGSAALASASAVAGIASLGKALSGARQYVRAVVTPTLTGGSSPSITLAAILRLFGPDRLPAL